jgi:hypothetical protein
MNLGKIAVAVMVMGSVGCHFGNIRVVKTSKAGGEIALLGSRDEAREMANAEMARNCGGNNYEVLEEGETVVGQVEQTSGSQTNTAGRTWYGAPATQTTGSSTTTTSQRTEWRLKYQCKGAAPAPAPTLAPAGNAPPAPGPQASISNVHELVLVY